MKWSPGCKCCEIFIPGCGCGGSVGIPRTLFFTPSASCSSFPEAKTLTYGEFTPNPLLHPPLWWSPDPDVTDLGGGFLRETYIGFRCSPIHSEYEIYVLINSNGFGGIFWSQGPSGYRWFPDGVNNTCSPFVMSDSVAAVGGLDPGCTGVGDMVING